MSVKLVAPQIAWGTMTITTPAMEPVTRHGSMATHRAASRAVR